MDEKSLNILEFPKILEKLASFCAFAVSKEKAHNLRPSDEMETVRYLQDLTLEACHLIAARPEVDIGGVHDIRTSIDLSRHGGVLDPAALLDIKYTLMAGRNLARILDRIAVDYPKLADLGSQIPQPPGVIDAITKAVSERGEILDSASDKLASIRGELHIIHDRLISKLQKMVSDSSISAYLQESLVTQRDGRYVLPLRSEFKGRIKAIVHDQSSSGATLFIEPISVVDLNNQYRELELNERDEVRRILMKLSETVAEFGNEIIQTLDVVAEIDLALAKAKLAQQMNAVPPELVSPHPARSSRKRAAQENKLRENNYLHAHSAVPGVTLQLFQARHPLLDPGTVVPIDVVFNPDMFILVITGPNTGGKTVTLKTVGLLVLMAQSGLHIPVENGSAISIYKDVLADIGDEQSIEQSLSTFSSHITNIIRIIQSADHSSLVLLDELGAGTDPQEGAALARALLNFLVLRGIPSLVTTHHPELKSYAHTTSGVENASVEFDLSTLKPTYHLTIGLPGRSNALAIAERLGLPKEIIQDARQDISPEDLHVEDLLDEIHQQREAARHSRSAADLARKNAEALRNELLERLDHIERERQQILNQSQIEAQAKLDELSVEIEVVRRELVQARQPDEVLRSIDDHYESLEERIAEPVEDLEPQLSPEWQKMEIARHKSLQVGDQVRLKALSAQGILTVLDEDEAEVQVGVIRVRTRLRDIEPVADKAKIPETEIGLNLTGVHSQTSKTEIAMHPSPGVELDLRGKRADEAQDELEQYLDAAFLAGLPFVRIIHGKGTGKLRQVVRKQLAEDSHILSVESGRDSEGGDGVTVAKFIGG